jgi:hypothetical protein
MIVGRETGKFFKSELARCQRVKSGTIFADPNLG